MLSIKIAGIITFNPSLNRLQENVERILPQVGYLIIVDNASSNLEEIKGFLSEQEKVIFLYRDKNDGVAKALNIMASKAIELGAEWLLTLDQDSVVADNIMSEYVKYTSNPSVGIITCRYIDRNTDNIDQFTPQENRFIPRCITSGTYMNLKIWEQVGGFYEPLFIDQVDFDYCYTLKEHGYRILQVGNTYVLHEIGKSKPVSLFGKYHIAFNHSPGRYYYMMRNMIVVAKRHKMWKHYMRVLCRRWLIVNRFENNRIHKNKMILKGLCHGFVGRMGKYEE